MTTHPASRTRSIILSTALLVAAGCGPAPDQPAAVTESLSPQIGTPPVGWQAAWTDVGSPFGATPALTSWGPGRVDLFLRNGDQLIQKARTPSSGWIPAGDHYWYIAAGLASDPSAVGWAGKNIDVVFRGTANNVVHVYWNGSGAWITEDLGGIIDGTPTISVAPDGTRMDVFARVGNSIWHRGWTAAVNNWSGWERLSLTTDSDPVAVSWGHGHIDLFYRAADGTTRRYSWDGPGVAQLAGQPWVTQPSLSGFAKGPPTVTSQRAGALDVFVQGGDDGIYQNSLATGGTFAGWTRLSGCTYGTPAVTMSDSLNMVVRDKNTHRILHDYMSMYPSFAPGPAPMCCGLLDQAMCASSGCDPSLGYNGLCVQCGYANEPDCINMPPLCQPGLGVDSDGTCRVCPAGTATFGGTTCRPPQVLSATKGLDGSIHVDVSLRAVENGGFAFHPHATNHNQVTGFMYTVDCHVGDHELAFVGHVDESSLLSVNGPGRDDPGIQGMQGTALATDWPTIAADWQGGIGTPNFDCTLTTQSTLAQSLDQIWAAISGAYMKAYGFDDLTKGHLCVIDCSPGIDDCPSKCAGGDLDDCSSNAECNSAYSGL